MAEALVSELAEVVWVQEAASAAVLAEEEAEAEAKVDVYHTMYGRIHQSDVVLHIEL